MHILTLPETVTIGPKDVITAGEYITDDVTAAHLIVLAGGGKMDTLKESRPIRDGIKSILLARMGGFGDLVLLTPVLRHLKAKHPGIKIAVSTLGDYAAAIQNLPYIDEILPYPVSVDTAGKYDAWVWFENAIEKNPRAESVHITDLFAEIAGIPFGDDADRKPDYRVKPSEAIWANEAYPRKQGLKRVCIQIGTSAMCRTYPRNQMGSVAAELLKRGYEVFLLGEKGEIRTPESMPENIKNLSDAGLTFRQSCAVLATADCVIGSDSALIHVAGAIGVPAIALYGPFPWKLRTAYAPTTYALTGVGDCAPCFHHVNPAKRNHFPEKCPTKKDRICGVLADIKPERIVAKVEEHARKEPPAPVFTIVE